MFRSLALSGAALAVLVACTTTPEPPATQGVVEQFVTDARQVASETSSS
jgi:outer membrane biogenesis lipoprotein LolB